MLDPIDPPGSRPPRVIPVIDVMNGVVVRAVGGPRSEYPRLRSRLTASADPIEVARVLLDTTRSDILYVADLNAIVLGEASGLVARLADAFPNVWIWGDIGLRQKADFARLPRWTRRETRLFWRRWRQRDNLIPVIGTETLAGPAAAGDAGSEYMPDVVVSLDLKAGIILGYNDEWSKAWNVGGPGDIDGMVGALCMTTGTPHLIVLDLADVGTGNGVTTDYWLKRIKCGRPDLAVFAGGGIRDWADIDRLARCHVDGVLVASALHDGTLTFPRPS
ncbi:MAG: hypothetical protein K2X82_14195 [Gemmataceae bacterium]|nr:hypothetical protein [Gemmataceae bacterium]